MDHLRIMKELAEIIRGEHPAWSGCRITNAECYLHGIRNDMPENAALLAQDLLENRNDFSDETGLSPDRITWAANRLLTGR